MIETVSHLKGFGMEKESISSLASLASLVIHSSDLFREKRLVLIKHRDDWYRLMLTKQDKLILTK